MCGKTDTREWLGEAAVKKNGKLDSATGVRMPLSSS